MSDAALKLSICEQEYKKLKEAFLYIADFPTPQEYRDDGNEPAEDAIEDALTETILSARLSSHTPRGKIDEN